MTNRTILAYFAHPDDETMLCGGTLALLSQLGHKVIYLSATRGEGGEVGDPPLCTHSELGSLRAKEFACAVRALGGQAFSFLGYVDPLVGADNQLYAFEADHDFLVKQVVVYIQRHQVGVVITHGSNGEYGHPAHRLVHWSVIEAARKLAKEDLIVYTVQAAYQDHPKPYLVNTEDKADLILDVSSVLEQKTNAALCHQTQHALFVRRTSEKTSRKVTVPEVITHVESLHRAVPKMQAGKEDWLYKLLKDSGSVIPG